jgi:hypothetical protein
MTKPVMNDMKQALEKVRAEAEFNADETRKWAIDLATDYHGKVSPVCVENLMNGADYQHSKSQALIDKLIRVVELIEPALTANDARRLLPEARRILEDRGE